MRINKNWLVFDGDGAPSGGDDKDKEKPKEEGQTPPEEKKNPEQPGKVEFSAEQQQEVERIVRERLAREKDKNKKTEEKARQDAEAEVLKKSEEWKQLASTYEERLAALSGMEEQLEAEKSRAAKYEKILLGYLADMMKDIPPHIKALIEKLDVVEQMEYLQKNVEQLKPTGEGKKPVPPSPKPDGSPQQDNGDAAKQSGLFYRRSF